MSISPEQLQKVLEAAIMVAGRPLTINDMQKLFDEGSEPAAKDIREALEAVQTRYTDSGIELCEVSSGFQFRARNEVGPWLTRLWEERAPRYSRALMETLALIAYRQPITRAEIEEIRGVTVSSHIVKTLQDREWIRVVGHRDVPGKPALLATTKTFLDHLGLKSLQELPALADLNDLESQEEKLQIQLELAATPSEESSEETIIDETITSEKTTSETPDEENKDEDNETLIEIEDNEALIDAEIEIESDDEDESPTAEIQEENPQTSTHQEFSETE